MKNAHKKWTKTPDRKFIRRRTSNELVQDFLAYFGFKRIEQLIVDITPLSELFNPNTVGAELQKLFKEDGELIDCKLVGTIYFISVLANKYARNFAHIKSEFPTLEAVLEKEFVGMINNKE